MDASQSRPRVTAIVPAYNEAGRINDVLTVLCASKILDEVIVVDDGSTDDIASVVRGLAVTYVRNQTNQGKGAALEQGIKIATGDIFFFCDADVRGLTSEVVEHIIRPVLEGEVEMFIGMRNRSIYWLRFILAFIPLLGGERVLTRELWERVPAYYKERFRIEAALNFYAIYYGRGFKFKVFSGLTQTIKEKKYGWRNGLSARCRMFRDIIFAQFKLYLVDTPIAAPTRMPRFHHIRRFAQRWAQSKTPPQS